MQIVINTEEITDLDRAVLAVLADGGATAPVAPKTEIAETAAPAPAKKAEPAKKAAAPKAEPEPEPEPEAEPVASSGATLTDAVEAATKLVSEGKAAKVKAALAEAGAKRVSELAEGDIPAFLAALDA
jgi:pyruvate/2-oxoglutarate dehydrogenase complex dihydrolipoamide acyltransferase (E2) component